MMKSLQSLSENSQEFEDTLRKKFIPQETLAASIEQLKSSGLSIATLNGSFDLFHAGHLYILFEAKKQADILLVLLNSDASIKKYKSSDRPIIDLENRMKMLASIQWVDYVSSFDETDPREILKKISPNVHVNGAEYGPDCIEKDVVLELGGRMHLVDRIPGLSTSNILKKVKLLCD